MSKNPAPKPAAKAPKNEAVNPGIDQDAQAHSDLRTMVEHAKIHADKPRLQRAMAKHKEMLAALQQAAAASQAMQAAPAGAPGAQPTGAPGAQPGGAPVGPAANGGAY